MAGERPVPQRLVVCVDGIWCDTDQSLLSASDNQNTTNVYRLFASVYGGEITDDNGKRFLQQKRYFNGIKSHDRGLTMPSAIASGISDNIREVYRDCCRLTGPEDEVWLFGFGRGGFVVQAVAGLLYHSIAEGKGEQALEMVSVIQNFRHALALNELTLAEHVFNTPRFNMNQELQRNLAVQAWFWMVSESKMLGLKFGSAEFAGDRASLMDPILLRILEGHGNPWSCTTDNGIRFEMADIQMLHEDERYSVRHGLAKPKGGVQKERIRTPFDKGGGLQSYSSGTTIHPSVYLLLDRYIGIGLDMQKFPFYDNLEKWRYKILGQDVDFPNQGFWNDAAIQDYKDFGPLRILVCGNTGVGKSSLINKVFGVPDSEEVTKSSNNVRAEYAKDIPVIVIATKKDDFEKIHFSDGVMSALAQGQTPDYENLAQFARDQVNRRLRDLEKLIMNLDGGRFDVCVAVSKDDDKSIQSLVCDTAECFSHEKIRLLYIRAQVARLDLKVDLALESVMAIYKNVVRRSTLTAGLPAATPVNRKLAAIKLCEAILSCFGIPGVDGKTAFDVYGRNIFDKEGNSIATATAEAIAAVSAITTGIFLGIPFFLISAGSNVPLVVPTTARLILMLACDLILMFSRGFQEASGKCNTQPQLADLEKAAAAYQAHSPRVHKMVKALVPGVSMCFRMDKIKLGIKEILQDSRQFFAGDNAAPPATPRPSSDSWNELASLQDTITEDITTIEQTGEDIVGQADRSDSASLFDMQSMKTVMRELMEAMPSARDMVVINATSILMDDTKNAPT
ncbi:uncharacterized protein CCOS01_16437 [Colletotrichum costaricense]|uniref:T6SS Phospholipase effector Tle1-like catalytic domain-containing protein n=1 Tax=Colletotrichum costaricense TaxID=1209916 RepID=A0AAI9YFR3_9PEZI|nr:uncharacterized protein CCOS01_16437 [Colletotrichum costaricense]KAK1506578.1 hypothetical protein CCOS01_16437 [Colletotrichum costaricense]